MFAKEKKKTYVETGQRNLNGSYGHIHSTFSSALDPTVVHHFFFIKLSLCHVKCYVHDNETLYFIVLPTI